MFDADHAADDEGGRWADAIGDHHGDVGERELERDGARFRHGRIRRGKGVEAVGGGGEHDREGPIAREKSDEVRRRVSHRNDDAQIRVLLPDHVERQAEDRQHAPHFA